MRNKPLTDEEKRQKAEWEKLIFPPGKPFWPNYLQVCYLSCAGPFEPLDDDFVDAAIAWSEGRGPWPE